MWRTVNLAALGFILKLCKISENYPTKIVVNQIVENHAIFNIFCNSLPNFKFSLKFNRDNKILIHIYICT